MNWAVCHILRVGGSARRLVRLVVTDAPADRSEVLSALETAGLGLDFSEGGIAWANHQLLPEGRWQKDSLEWLEAAPVQLWEELAGSVAIRRLTLRLPAPLHAQLRMAAQASGISLQEASLSALQHWVSRTLGPSTPASAGARPAAGAKSPGRRPGAAGGTPIPSSERRRRTAQAQPVATSSDTAAAGGRASTASRTDTAGGARRSSRSATRPAGAAQSRPAARTGGVSSRPLGSAQGPVTPVHRGRRPAGGEPTPTSCAHLLQCSHGSRARRAAPAVDVAGARSPSPTGPTSSASSRPAGRRAAAPPQEHSSQ